MKLKYLIIALLLVLLGYTVYRMMKYEDEIRKKNIIKEYVEDEDRPLIEDFSPEALERAAAGAVCSFRSKGDFFTKLTYKYQDDTSTWDTLLIKAVNIGFALPGKYPAEFSLDFDHYLDWLEMIGKMNANAIRVYTILPPLFYDAFARYNLLHEDRPLYLIQGIWADMPADHDYFGRSYSRSVRQEIIDAIDVIHGNSVLPERRGKASGVYTTDVSDFVLAILFGHEWEPNTVFVTNDKNKSTRYVGEFISVNHGNATEVWLAEMLDFCIKYETQFYGMQRPVSFVNWLPLDPMFHNTETIERNHTKRFDNDLESLDFCRFQCSPLYRAGLFASYHAYPYYPDFIHQEDKYRTINDGSDCVCVFKAYLLDLKEHTQGMPLVITEYGVPSSRGNSHSNEFGFDQGGHSEADHASLNLDLTRTIFETGCAGAVFFEWVDEWFKHNWLVMHYEIPSDERKNWHNLENPEQNYGILALENKQRAIDGNMDDWQGSDFHGRKNAIAFHADPTYFYVAMKLEDFSLGQNNLYIALDVIDPERGDHKLPFSDRIFGHGYEFLAEIKDTGNARLLTDKPYAAFPIRKKGEHSQYAPVANSDGIFVEEVLIPNDSRISLDGKKFDDIYYYRNRLKFGISSEPATSNADWYYDPSKGIFELRLTWPMLNVTSPGSRLVLDDDPGTDHLDVSETEEFRISAFITDKQDKLITQVPARKPASFTWEKWGAEPEYTSRLKPVYDSLSGFFRSLRHSPFIEGKGDGKPSEAYIGQYYDDKPGAISISFGNAALSQFELVPGIMSKYRYKATFAVGINNIESADYVFKTDETGRLPRMGLSQVRALVDKGHNLALNFDEGSGDPVEGLPVISPLITFSTIVSGRPADASLTGHPFIFQRPRAGRGIYKGSWKNTDFTLVTASPLSGGELNTILTGNRGGWTIAVYHTIVPEDSTKRYTGADQVFETPVEEFERHVRIARNTGYWVAPEEEVFRYLYEYRHSKLMITSHEDMIFIKIDNNLDKEVFDQPLTVVVPVDAAYVSVTGSVHDGIYSNRTGVLKINAIPGREVTLKQIDP